MIKYLKTTTVATMAILTMLNTGAVFAQSNKDVATKESVAVVNTDKLNVRSGPSTSYDIIGSFEKEDSVDLISIKDGWYKIKLEDGKKAWTNGQYITLDGEVTVDKLNVRKGPAITYDIIGSFSKNDGVDLLSIKNGWYKIEMEDGKIAWTNGQYITLAGEVTADKLNIRKGPATSYDIVGNKVKEDKVKVLKAFENGWYEIELEDGETGFICGKYVDTKVENEHDYSELNNKTTTTTTSTSAKPVSTSTTQSSSNVVKTMTVSATAYAGDSMTSTGAIPKVGRTIAVDPSVIPYGTRVYIPALGGVYVAEDCGGAIKGNKIDIFMASESACNSWGVRSIEIQILK